MSSITSPSWNDVDYTKTEATPPKRGHSVDRIIYHLFALLGMCNGVAAAVVMSAAEPAPLIPIPEGLIDIWADWGLLGVCFWGTMLGTAARLVFPTPELNVLHGAALARALAAKAVLSMSCGLIVSPMVLRYLEWHPDRQTIVFVSGAVAFLAEVTLSIATRVYQKWAENKANELTGTK